MRETFVVVCFISHLTMCRLASDFNSKSSPQENVTTLLPVSPSVTEGIWPVSDQPLDVYNSTRVPQYMRLGNQTVDINRSFKVPQTDDALNEIIAKPTDNIANATEKSEIISVNATSAESSAKMTEIFSTSDVKSDDGVPVNVTSNVASNLVSSISRSWQGTKHEHEGRYGPQFEDADRGDNSTVVVQAGDTALLDCRVSLLRDKTVSWVRRREGEAPLLLTVGAATYTGDSRYAVQFRYPGNWRLKLSDANSSDEGLYECQLSTHPPRVISVYLLVNTLQVSIVDEVGLPLREQYYEAGSTLVLRCSVRGARAPGAVWWLHGTLPLHRDALRGGVAVKTEALRGGGGDSTLQVARLSPIDAGNYTCTLPGAPPRHKYTVLVHVLNESLAELQQGSCNGGPQSLTALLAVALMTVIAFAVEAPS